MLSKIVKVLGYGHVMESSYESHNEIHEKFHAHMANEGLSFGTWEEYKFRLAIF